MLEQMIEQSISKYLEEMNEIKYFQRWFVKII